MNTVRLLVVALIGFAFTACPTTLEPEVSPPDGSTFGHFGIVDAGELGSSAYGAWIVHTESEFRLDMGLVAIDSFSRITGGTVTTSASGPSYVISWSLETDADITLTGSYTGQIDRAE